MISQTWIYSSIVSILHLIHTATNCKISNPRRNRLVLGPTQTHPENIVWDQVALKFHTLVRLVVASGATRADYSNIDSQAGQH